MSDNVAIQYPDLEFIRPCNLCPHMKTITLGKIRGALETMQHEVAIDESVAARARLAVERMLAVK
jgi:quinolinate synthase